MSDILIIITNVNLNLSHIKSVTQTLITTLSTRWEWNIQLEQTLIHVWTGSHGQDQHLGRMNVWMCVSHQMSHSQHLSPSRFHIHHLIFVMCNISFLYDTLFQTFQTPKSSKAALFPLSWQSTTHPDVVFCSSHAERCSPRQQTLHASHSSPRKSSGAPVHLLNCLINSKLITLLYGTRGEAITPLIVILN